MREIKFRGKDTQWYCGDLEYSQKNDVARIHTYNADGSYNKQYVVDPDSVGQFTGLLDKNGKEIYEGDIVRKCDLTFGLKYEGVVVYNSEIGAFRIHSENNGITMRTGFIASDVYNDGQCTVPIKYDYEVIGKIYDNPELLTKE